MPFQAYISGALTDVPDPEGTKKFYEDLGRAFEEVAQEEFGIADAIAYIPHHHGDPIKHADLSPMQIREMDRQHVRDSKLMVMYTGRPSHGTGREHEWALADGTPIIALFEEERFMARKVSRLARVDVTAHAVFLSYGDGVCEFKKVLRELLMGHFKYMRVDRPATVR